jgi:hypothetical protein
MKLGPADDNAFDMFIDFTDQYDDMPDDGFRVTLNPPFSFPNNCVGWIQNNYQYGNAFLISPSFAMTSAHNFFSFSKDGTFNQ